MKFAAPEGTRRIEGQVANISQDGALVLADNPPPAGALVWLRLESPVRTDWFDARVVRSHHEREIGIRFTVDCPDDLLLAASVGIDLGFLVRGGPKLSTACD